MKTTQQQCTCMYFHVPTVNAFAHAGTHDMHNAAQINPQLLSYLSEYSLYHGTQMVSTPRIAPLHQRM